MSLPSPPPDGEPLYVALPPPIHTAQYGTRNPHYFGYPPPYAPTALAPGRRCEPWTGWLLAATAVLALLAALLPWASLTYPTGSGAGSGVTEVVRGYQGVLGPPTVVLYLLCIVFGSVIGGRRGGVWIAGLSLATSVVLLVVLLVKSAVIELSADLALGDSAREPAYWLALVATVGVLAVSVLALVRRHPDP